MQGQASTKSPPANDTVGDKSRSAILAAAAQCFLDKGYTETSIDDVARRLSSTKGRIYHHFASKADLFAAIFRAGMDQDYAAIAPFRDQPGPAIDRLRAMARAHCREVIASRAYQRIVWQGVRMILRSSTTPELRDELNALNAYREAYERVFRAEIERARAEGALVFENLGLSASLMFVSLNSPIFWYVPRAGETEKDVNKLVEQVVAYAMLGLGAKSKE